MCNTPWSQICNTMVANVQHYGRNTMVQHHGRKCATPHLHVPTGAAVLVHAQALGILDMVLHSVELLAPPPDTGADCHVMFRCASASSSARHNSELSSSRLRREAPRGCQGSSWVSGLLVSVRQRGARPSGAARLPYAGVHACGPQCACIARRSGCGGLWLWWAQLRRELLPLHTRLSCVREA